MLDRKFRHKVLFKDLDITRREFIEYCCADRCGWLGVDNYLRFDDTKSMVKLDQEELDYYKERYQFWKDFSNKFIEENKGLWDIDFEGYHTKKLQLACEISPVLNSFETKFNKQMEGLKNLRNERNNNEERNVNIMNITLKQALEQTGRAEFDISDTVFDSFCVAFVYDTGAKELLGEDDYNKVLGWMAENIEVKSFDDGTAECKVSDFIEKNYELFKNFCTEHNNDYYQMDRKDIDTNIEIALATVKSLIVGGYGDKAYGELANEIDKDKNEPSHEDEER